MEKYNITLKRLNNTDIIRIYENPIFSGFKTYSIKHKEFKSLINRQRSNVRAKNTITELLLLNFSNECSFMTLTFRDNIDSIKESNMIFQSFIKKLKYYLSKHFKDLKLKYIAVPETQKRGALHFHVICNLPKFINYKDLIYLWQKSINNQKSKRIKIEGGTLHIKRLDSKKNNPKYLARYLTKYLTKQNPSSKFIGAKTYFCSKGLKRAETQKLYLNNNQNLNYTLKELEKLANIKSKNIKKIDTYINPYDQSKVTYIEHEKIIPSQ